MTTAGVTSTPNTLKDALNNAKPETIADILRLIEFGTFMRGQSSQVLRRMVPAADPSAPTANVQTIVLPMHARASRIHRAYARKVSGGAVTGELTPDTGTYADPASGHIAVQPDGNIALLTADAITDVDVLYTPERGDVVALPSLPVAANVMDLAVLEPALTKTPGGVVALLSVVATGTLGTAVALRITAPATSNAVNGTVCLHKGSSSIDGKSRLLFSTGGDAVTSAVVTLLTCAANDLMTLLGQASPLL